jgi:mono/diheme cytochrome c family protein
MKRRRWLRRAAVVIVIVVPAAIGCTGGSETRPAGVRNGAAAQVANDSAWGVTAVQGPSWIAHLGIQDIRQTAMGQAGGSEPPPSSPRQEPGLTGGENLPRRGMGMGSMMGRIYSVYRSDEHEVARLMDETFLLSGSDLYRLNCQSCHGPKGDGRPPEINSLIQPVQGASPAFIEQRMKSLGHPVGAEMAQRLAAEADSALRERLDKGGKKMPAFVHLNHEERGALLAFLRVLAGVPGSSAQEDLVTESVARVGEHLVKGTCHICHGATGPGGGHMAMMQGTIPSLASFPREKTLQDVVRQVEQGSLPMTSMMGGPSMPAYPYITGDEAAAAYLYLVKYPPKS